MDPRETRLDKIEPVHECVVEPDGTIGVDVVVDRFRAKGGAANVRTFG
jgi:hypothetical protein